MPLTTALANGQTATIRAKVRWLRGWPEILLRLRGSFLEGRMAPDITVPDRAGRPVHLSRLRGKKVLVVTWASW